MLYFYEQFLWYTLYYDEDYAWFLDTGVTTSDSFYDGSLKRGVAIDEVQRVCACNE